jgi:hypothetical protein
VRATLEQIVSDARTIRKEVPHATDRVVPNVTLVDPFSSKSNVIKASCWDDVPQSVEQPD